VVLWHPEGFNGVHPVARLATNASIKNFLTISFALTPCTLTPLNSLCTLIDYSAITSTFSTALSGDDEVVIKQF
jgi:hypothetical protein